ncbi:DUF1574 domain-containing protein [Cylindrospermum sp. FACHB-282]|uniref:DUF1574 domain-containing protein n=1 Tax=Cylindrospermum sp. FACHB-282 TaxID=2692794 RepID=UPI001683CEF6|nr:DUF1574 domain-containing protein [Cylindrospermum sp. FACHB-282]MBD2385739.1 DUF1574 domain-containing protein [Cylindrospermum sp. FACHB-282]
MKTALLDRQQSLVKWVSQATGINTFGVKVRLRGNDLHILCEGTECPQRWRTLSDLLQALQQTDLDTLTSNEQPSIYQVFVYGRRKGEHRPQWCHRVYLNQLDRHLEQVKQALIADSEKSRQYGGALIVSNESLARQGNPDAIARYLSENLSTLGVAVQVKIKQPGTNSQPASKRLWILCGSVYSPDASLLAEPVAQKLRHLKLVGYQDAVIVSQVSGETAPDWLLRVDLTPPEAMLKEWARWGDVQAIARLLTDILSESKIAVQAALKESTLHIFCTPAFDPLETERAPDKTVCLQAILPQLEAIAPQGILAATIYGQKTIDKQPAWIDWSSLPAADHPALATSALDLGIAGDERAIIFLLERLLNPDLDGRLKTGGIRVILLRKADLLHIMCDAPICPTRQQVASKVAQLIRQLKIPGLIGVRVYGRRAGDKEPNWHYGIDFGHRQRLVPEATPEFAATAEYVNDLIISETNEPMLRPDLTTQEVQSFVTEVARDWVATTNTTARKWLLATQLFTEIGQSAEQSPDNQGLRSSLVWVALGLLLTLQTDWMLGYVITHTNPTSPKVATVWPPASSNSKPALTMGENQSEITAFFANTGKRKSPQAGSSAFNASGFTQNDDRQSGLPAAPLKPKATATAILLAARARKAGASLTQMPSFNARQLDEQLALYKQRLATTGSPPDVLIIGSSRALRGVDPVALSQALATQGYANIDVFNFGINGATAKVVDFIIRQLLEPSELPKVILWADGSRAFNSGREDITFNAISASNGYKQALQKALTTASSDGLRPAGGDRLPKNSANPTSEPKHNDKAQEINSYQVVNQWLDQSLAGFSASYQHRDQIQTLLQKQLKYLPFSDRLWRGVAHGTQKVTSQIQSTTNNPEEDNSQQSVDFDGFLPLSIRFNPARYYQKHPRVPGNYDNDYRYFQVGGEQDAAFQSVLDFTQSHKISLIFVNMPLTSDYLDAVRKKHEQEFQQYMLSFAANSNFVYRDLSPLWLTRNDYFSDPSHLNRFGAYEVSKKLANDPMIPWPAK